MISFDAHDACDSRNPRLSFTRIARNGCYARNKFYYTFSLFFSLFLKLLFF